MRKPFTGVLLLFLLAALLPFRTLASPQKSRPAAPAAARPARTFGNADAISAAELKDYLYFIASDELEGRDTPSRGLDTAAKFIVAQLSRWGVKPAGVDGSFFQPIALQKMQLDGDQSEAQVDGQKFVFGQDFLVGADPRQPLVGGTAAGGLVFAGNGYVVKARNLNPYQEIDVTDKILVVASGLPRGVSASDLTGAEGESWETPAGYGSRHGAKGMIFLPTFQTLANWARIRQRAAERGRPEVVRFRDQGGPRLPTITASPALLEALFLGERRSAAQIFNAASAGDPGESFPLNANKRASFTVAVKSESSSTQNVVAVLEGSDPALKDEYVAFGAHYDHIGIGRPVNGDAIYNGADDDGSGTVTLLAMANAFAHAPRPKRSILFVWHCGEEKGLWGSRYFTQFPTVSLDHIVAQLNIDMIGRSKKEGDTNSRNRELSGPNEIYVIGSKMMSTDLGELSERVNRAYLNLAFNYRYDDPSDPNGFFFRSDHYSYAQKGVPIIFYFDGVHQDYHQPSDSPDKIDYQKMEKVARTICATGWEIANGSQRPRVDKQLPAELGRGRRR
jgi:hypothetical protein